MKSNTVLPKKIILKQQKSVEDRNASKTDERLDDFGTKFPLSKVFWDPIPAVSAWHLFLLYD